MTDNADDPVRLTAHVHGLVQGVGFRWWTRSRALELGLVVNALKYSEAVVTVKWTDTVVGPALLVEDKGPGIDAKHIPRLTERFYRIDKSRSQATGGTGLGLAIVKHVAVSHDAKLFVDSQPGRGSTFRLVFPADRAVTASDSPAGVTDT